MTTYPGIPFPDIDPVLFQWGWIIIRWYSLAYIFGLLGAWGLARKMSKVSNSPFTVLKIDDFLLWATIGVVVGGRLGYVLFYNFRYFMEFPLQIFYVWQGGMAFHGGLLGVIIATLLFAFKKKIPVLSMGDILTCVAPIGLFLGRLANFVNGELYGRVSQSVPWVMIFPGSSYRSLLALPCISVINWLPSQISMQRVYPPPFNLRIRNFTGSLAPIVHVLSIIFLRQRYE